MKEKRTIEDTFVAAFGSWGFIFGFLLFVSLWSLLHYYHILRFDAWPHQGLNLVLAVFAGIQAPIMLIGQARADKKRDALLKKIERIDSHQQKELDIIRDLLSK